MGIHSCKCRVKLYTGIVKKYKSSFVNGTDCYKTQTLKSNVVSRNKNLARKPETFFAVYTFFIKKKYWWFSTRLFLKV